MASTNNTLTSPDISDIIHLLNTMKKQNEDILAQNKEILNDNRKLRQELLELKSYYPKHNVKASSRKRDEPENEDELVDQNDPSNPNKRARVSVASVTQAEPEPERILDRPASFDSLDDDCLGNVLDFVGKKCYSAFGRVNKRCHEMFCLKGFPKVTYIFYGYGPLQLIQQRSNPFRSSIGVLQYNRRDIFEWLLTDESDDDYRKLIILCSEAIEESRLDILCEIFQRANVEQLENLRDADYDYGPCFCQAAAFYGKLECLKLLRENECEWNEFAWPEAKHEGHEHILKYLRNNGYPRKWQIDSEDY